MAPLTILAGILLGTMIVLTVLFRRRRSLRQLRGPPASFLWGTNSQIRNQENVGDLDFKCINEYGTAWRIGGPLGEDILMLADPKALQHIFHKSGYNYPKGIESAVMTRVIMGKGIAWAHGDVHQRHRKVMNPAFTAPQLRSFLPMFRSGSVKMCQLWKDEVLSASEKGTAITVNKWLARLTLDIVGEAAFDFKFGSLDSEENEVSQAYSDMFVDSVLHQAKWDIIFKAMWRYLPERVLDFVDYIPTREYKRFRKTAGTINKVAKKLVDEKTAALLEGNMASKDAMSVLVRSNVSENPKRRLNEEEMIAQMSTLMLAGHETTANTLTWYLYELAKNQAYQDKLRKEVLSVRSCIAARGDSDLTIADLDSMVYLPAGMKETLRYHPIVYHLQRTAGKDDVIPLSYPVRTKSGEILSHIPVQKGQNILVSICGYNRLTDVWGEDADTWNPMRFIERDFEKQIKIGTYSNLMSFSAGLRGCIGWRFSVIEMQAILFDLIENFEFSLPDGGLEIRRMPTGLMGPLVKDKMEDGLSMPLHVTPI